MDKRVSKAPQQPFPVLGVILPAQSGVVSQPTSAALEELQKRRLDPSCRPTDHIKMHHKKKSKNESSILSEMLSFFFQSDNWVKNTFIAEMFRLYQSKIKMIQLMMKSIKSR